jgi:hypothetical protein
MDRMVPERGRLRIGQTDGDRASRHPERDHETADQRAGDPQATLLKESPCRIVYDVEFDRRRAAEAVDEQ